MLPESKYIFTHFCLHVNSNKQTVRVVSRRTPKIFAIPLGSWFLLKHCLPVKMRKIPPSPIYIFFKIRYIYLVLVEACNSVEDIFPNQG